MCFGSCFGTLAVILVLLFDVFSSPLIRHHTHSLFLSAPALLVRYFQFSLKYVFVFVLPDMFARSYSIRPYWEF